MTALAEMLAPLRASPFLPEAVNELSALLAAERQRRDKFYQEMTPEMKVEILKGIPLNRLGDAIDVARIYLFLASELSGYVTGAVIDVNGGMLIH
jgi:NAD(P)-dependent dehydrogenase (short-subunit alcohol dehydrogenase family)